MGENALREPSWPPLSRNSSMSSLPTLPPEPRDGDTQGSLRAGSGQTTESRPEKATRMACLEAEVERLKDHQVVLQEHKRRLEERFRKADNGKSGLIVGLSMENMKRNCTVNTVVRSVSAHAAFQNSESSFPGIKTLLDDGFLMVPAHHQLLRHKQSW